MKSDYRMYLIAPEGAEHLASVVVAVDEEGALTKAKAYPSLKPYADLRFTVVDLNEHFLNSGYNVNITKYNQQGIYH